MNSLATFDTGSLLGIKFTEKRLKHVARKKPKVKVVEGKFLGNVKT